MAASKERMDNYKLGNLEPQVITARAQLQQLLSREDLHLERSTEDNSTATLDSLAEEFDEALSSLSMDTNSAVRLLSEARAVAEDRLGLGSTNLANMDETFAELPLAKVRSSAAVFARLLEESKDEQVLRETCLGLCQLFGDGIQNDRIQAILETDVVPKLIALLQPQQKSDGVRFPVSVAVQSAALQVIGNIACGDDRQTQIIIDCNALPCLKALLSSPEKGIRKECCWIISNITESAHQVEDVIEADILPTLIELIDNNDVACREDASWVLYNITANFDERQIQYLVDKGGVNSFCNLLESTKELDVFWKCCSTISSIALKGLRNILFVGEQMARTYGKRYNPYAALVVECGGVEKIEMLAQSSNMELVRRALSIIQTFFGAESVASSVNIRKRISAFKSESQEPMEYENSDSEESICSDLDDDVSDHDLQPPALAPCQCVLCTDTNPLYDKKSKSTLEVSVESTQMISQPFGACEFCDMVVSGQFSSRVVLAGKLGRAVRMGHSHCLAAILARMKWGDRSAAIETPAAVRLVGSKSNGRPSHSNSMPETSLPAFVLAAKLGKPLCLEMIIRKCKPELDATFGRKRLTALAWAAYKGYLRCCQILLDNGANPQARCADGLTALHLAASSGYTRIISLLLERGAQVDIKSAKGQTPLFHACQKGHSQVVQLLLAAGANANLQDEQQVAALHLAAIYGQSDCARVLIQEGNAQVDIKNSSETTPLHYAVRGGHVEVVKCLMENGAIPSSTTSHISATATAGGGGGGLSVQASSLLFIAVENGDLECTRILLEFGCSVHQTATIKLLIHKEYETNDCLQPLALAASKGHAEMVDLLIQHNANIHARTSKGWSPLDLAILNGHTACVKKLLSYGAIVDDKVRTLGKMSFTLVQFSARFGHREMLRMLVDKLKSQQENKNTGFAEDHSYDKSLAVHSSSDMNGSSENSNNCYSATSSNRTTDQSSTTTMKRRPQREISKASNMGGEDFFKRERKRKEVEANEVLTKLDDAINCKSIPKLTESIAHANKLLLQIAALRPDSQPGNYSKDEKVSKSSSSTGLDDKLMSLNQSGIEGGGGSNHSSLESVNKQVASDFNPQAHHPFALGRKLEYHLSKNIQRARDTLSRIQEEERRWREERLEMERRIHQEQTRKHLSEALSAAEKIGDHKALIRALKRAERLGMTQESLYQEAQELNERIRRAMDVVKYLQSAQAHEEMEQVKELIQQGRNLTFHLPALVAKKIFGETYSVLDNAETWFHEKEREKQRAFEQQQKKQAEEQTLIDRAEPYLEMDESAIPEKLCEMEQVMKDMEQFVAQQSEDVSEKLKSATDSIKKKLTKIVKAERKKLRQLGSSQDEEYIENELNTIRDLCLNALSRDIQQVERHLERLRATKAIGVKFQSAVESNDLEMMNKWKQEMESLGMVKEAEEARVVIEQRRRQTFFQSQLENFLEETKELLDHSPESVDKWPDGRRLSILCKKAQKYEGLEELIKDGYLLAQRLGEWCRSKLLSESECGDPKTISHAVENFVVCLGEDRCDDSVSFDPLFDEDKCYATWQHAQQRLMDSQARIQEQVWMELSSSKLEPNNMTKTGEESTSLEERKEFVSDQDKVATERNHSKEASKKRISRPWNSSVEVLRSYSSGEETCGDTSYIVQDEMVENIQENCTHYYVWLDRNQVICNKCKHVYVSQNTEWLERVKHRTLRASSASSTRSMRNRKDLVAESNHHPLEPRHSMPCSSSSSSNSSSSPILSFQSSLKKPQAAGSYTTRNSNALYEPTEMEYGAVVTGLKNTHSDQSVCFGTFMDNVSRLSDRLSSYYADSQPVHSVPFIYPSMTQGNENTMETCAGLWNHSSSSPMQFASDHHDISEEFAKENFGFHIEDIVDEDNNTGNR